MEQYVLLVNSFLVEVCTLSFGIESTFIGLALTKDIKNSLNSINFNAESKEKQSNLLQNLRETIELHSNLIQLSGCDDCFHKARVCFMKYIKIYNFDVVFQYLNYPISELWTR